MIPVYHTIVDEIIDVCARAETKGRRIRHIKLNRAEFVEFFRELDGCSLSVGRKPSKEPPIMFNGVWLVDMNGGEDSATKEHAARVTFPSPEIALHVTDHGDAFSLQYWPDGKGVNKMRFIARNRKTVEDCLETILSDIKEYKKTGGVQL